MFSATAGKSLVHRFDDSTWVATGFLTKPVITDWWQHCLIETLCWSYPASQAIEKIPSKFGNPKKPLDFRRLEKEAINQHNQRLMPWRQLKFLTGLASFGWIYQPFFSATWFEITESTIHYPSNKIFGVISSVKTWGSFFLPGNFRKKRFVTFCDLNIFVEIPYRFLGWSCCFGDRFPLLKRSVVQSHVKLWGMKTWWCWSLRPLFKPRPFFFAVPKKPSGKNIYQISLMLPVNSQCFF